MPQKLPNFSGQREFLYLSRILLPFETRGCSCMCACATRILATASIRERRLFAQHVRRCGDNSRTATNRERRLVESGVWSSKYGTVFSTVLRRNWKTPTVFGWEFSYCKTKLFVLSVIDTFQLSWLALLTAWQYSYVLSVYILACTYTYSTFSAVTLGKQDHLWQSKLVTFGCQEWSPRPVFVAKFCPAIGPLMTREDHFWQPKVVSKFHLQN